MVRTPVILPLAVLLAMVCTTGSAAADTLAHSRPDRTQSRPQAPNSGAQEASWTRGPDLPYGPGGPGEPGAADNGAAAVDSNGYYSIGGRDGMITFADTWYYDVALGTWLQKASLPHPLHGISACASGTMIYVPGGVMNSGLLTTTATLYAYDTGADSWSTKESAPAGYAGYACVAYAGLIYRLGGGDLSYHSYANVYRYDPGADTWTEMAPMTTPRRYFGALALNGKIYVAGGLTSDLDVTGTPKAEVYDIASDSWDDAAMADLPSPIYGAFVLPWQGTKLALTGGVVNGVISGSSRVYVPANDTWTSPDWSPLNVPRYRGAGAVVANRLFTVGGISATGVGGVDGVATHEFLVTQVRLFLPLLALGSSARGVLASQAPTAVQLIEFNGGTQAVELLPGLWLGLSTTSLLALASLVWVTLRRHFRRYPC